MNVALAPVRSPAPLRRPAVLCVDDEPLVLAGLTHTLRGRYDVRTAASGAEALVLLEHEGPFTVVVSDFAMPGMNGAECLARSRAVAPDAVRILLSGHARLEHAIAAINEGAIFRFLLKPCAPGDLVRSIDEAVEHARIVTADRELMQSKLDAMTGRLLHAERLASLGTMAAAVGHELNNLAMTITGAGTLIEDAVAAGEAPDPSAAPMLQAAQDQLALHARNLLDLGRPAASAGSASCELRGVAGDVLEMLRLAGLLRRVTVRFDRGGEPAPVRVSRAELEQVLVNLVKNAAEALMERASDPAIRVRIRIDREEGTAACEIGDNAAGIPEAELPHIFEPYFTTKPPERGTGLGLFVVRQIAERAGGTVSVKSEAGVGTTFLVSLPMVEMPSAPGV